MQALPVKTRLTMPMVLAVLVLAGGFIAIAVTVNWATAGSSARIEQATTAGAAAVNAPSPMTNDIAGSLPAFTLDLDGAAAYDPEPVRQGWADAQPLDTMGEGALIYVWMDAWFACAFITEAYEYKPVGSGDTQQNPQDALDIVRWNELTFRQQQDVKGECDR